MRLVVGILSTVCLAAADASSQVAEIAKLRAQRRNVEDLFGCSASVWNDRAVIGASRWDGYGDRSGSAYIFERQQDGSWIQVTELKASDATGGDIFGESVSIWEDRAVVGAMRVNYCDDCIDPPGAAYFFERQPGGTWVEVTKVTDGKPSRFGEAVSIWGDYALVGAPVSWGFRGVYVFERQADGTWAEAWQIPEPLADGHGRFGVDVSLWDSRALIGYRGSGAYVYERRTSGEWVQTGKLHGSDTYPGLGRSVSLWGDRAVLGDATRTEPTPAYIFERTRTGEWKEAAKLFVDHGGFGDAVAIGGNYALVSASRLYGSLDETVYVYERHAKGRWSLVRALHPDPIVPDQAFGWSVAISGTTVVVGAGGDSAPQRDCGSAYVFDFTPMESTVSRISASAGGIQDLQLEAGHLHTGDPYLVLGSTHGTVPGVALPGGLVLPLNRDPYLLRTLFGQSEFLVNAAGNLDAAGRATASFVVPPNAAKDLVGRLFHHAFLTFDTSPLGRRRPSFASNAVPLEIAH